jgi:RimJ/RimL family protein N-acetyltransferase
MTRITGERVTLRGFRSDELDELLSISEAWPTDDGIHWGSRDREELRRKVDASGKWTDVAALDMAIEADGRLVGEVQARQPRGGLPPGVFELGIEIFALADRGAGLGAAAIRSMVSHLFDEEQAHRVQLSTDVDNVGMRRCAESVGFTYEGVNRGFMPTAKGPRDYAMFGITRGDLEEVRARWI